MIDTAEVILWGTRIGIIHKDEDRPYVSFEYDKAFLRSGIELSPIHMKLSDRVYEFPSLSGEAFHGAPGLVADSLPDKFGNKIIERWLMEQGRGLDDFTVIDRLCYTGSRGMGALEYRPSAGPDVSHDQEINIRKMVDFASKVLKDRADKNLNLSDDIGYSQLLRLGTSAGGARAKALIAWNETTNEVKSGQTDAGEGFEYWLMKFDGVANNGDHGIKDRVEYTLIEYAYYLMARDAGIIMNECRIFEDGGLNHFMTKRFDRSPAGKLHMQTLGALAHMDYNIPGLCSYEQASRYMRVLGLSMKSVEQFFTRMVFNVILVNRDDHVKNVSFLMDRRGEWKLAPAYDITFSYNLNNRWLKAHQMLINGKNEDIGYEDLISAGRTMGLGRRRCDSIISNVAKVASDFRSYLEKAGVRESITDSLQKVVDIHSALITSI